MENRLVGLDIQNFTLWEAKQLNESYQYFWIGTSRNNNLLIHFSNAEAVIEFFLDHFKDTDSIQAMIQDQYHSVVMSQVAVKTKMEMLNEMLHLSEVPIC